MKKIIFLICIPFLSCNSSTVLSPAISTANTNTIKVNKTLYDTIQNFEKFNVANNYRPSLYLLDFLNKKNDTINFILTTIISKQEIEKHFGCPSFYNLDSSVLIIDNGTQLVFSEQINKNLLPDKSEVEIINEGDILYSPLFWRIFYVKNKLYVDREYGIYNSQVKTVVPFYKFRPNNNK